MGNRNRDMTALMTNLSDFQETQIEVLSKISESFSSSLNVSNSIKSNLDTLNNSINSMINTTTANVNRSTTEAEKFNDAMVNAVIEVRSRERAENELQREKKKSEEDYHANRMRLLQYFEQKAMQLVTSLAKSADNYSKITNNLISITGAGTSAKSVRKSIVTDVITDLNMNTGAYFNAEKSYEELVNIYKSAGVGSPAAMKELAKPILLAQESMDISTNSLTSLLNKWYTRYSFSSRGMETMVDEIRGNTANNNATAEATMKNLSSMSSWMEYYSNGDEDKLSAMTAAVAKGTSWLESMNIDSARYADYINKIASGEANSDKQLVQILHAAGGLSGLDAQNMFASGNIEELFSALASGESSIVSSLNSKDVRLLGQTLDKMSMDKSIVDTYNAFNSKGFTSLNDFVESTSTISAEEAIEQKYISALDKSRNQLSGIAEGLAGIQETLGIGLSDIITIIGLIAGAVGVGKINTKINSLLSGGAAGGVGAAGGAARGVGGLGRIIGNVSTSSTGGVLNTGALGSGFLGLLEEGGYIASGGTLAGGSAAALGAGVGLAGIAGLAYGGIAGYNDIKKGNTAIGATEIGGGLAMGGGSAALLAAGTSNFWNPVGWALLIAGGVSLIGTAMIKNAEAVDGTADAITKQYDDAAKKYKENLEAQDYTLNNITSNLNRTGDTQQAAADLINTGLLSEKDRQSALKAAQDEDIEALKALTDAYREATGEFAPEYEGILNRGKDQAIKQEEGLKLGLTSYYENHKDNLTDQDYKDLDNVLKTAMYDLQDQEASGVKLNKADKKLLKSLTKGYEEDQQFDEKEINKIMSMKYGGIFGAGAHNAIQGSSISTDKLATMGGMWGRASDYISVSGGLAPNTEEVAEQLSKISTLLSTGSKEEAIELLNNLKASGYSSEDNKNGNRRYGYEEIEDLCEEAGIPVFRVGTNYVPRNQFAYLHEGEAVVPKAYNPAANTETMKEMISVMTEIKEFLKYWKDDSMKREDIRDRVSRMNNSSVSATVSRYMPEY